MNNTESPLWEIWEPIEIGNFKSIKELEEAIKNKNIMDNIAKSILESSKFTLSKVNKEVNLVIVSLDDLSHMSRNSAFYNSYDRICELAFKKGLKFCPDETCFQICLQSKKLLGSLELSIAMEPIYSKSNKEFNIFHISHWKNEDKSIIYGIPAYLKEDSKKYKFKFRSCERFNKFIFCT